MDNAATSSLRVESDELARCAWVGEDDEYRTYHDEESQTPLRGDRALYEKFSLVGAWIEDLDDDSPAPSTPTRVRHPKTSASDGHAGVRKWQRNRHPRDEERPQMRDVAKQAGAK